MFEELNQHRAAVAENIKKACEIGFTGNELEKAHKVGDIHPNGKWVWTQLPSGKYDWRVIKKTGAGSGAAAPATAQKPKKEEEIKGVINILKQKPNERHFEIMDDAELKRFRDVAHKCWLDDENLNRSTRIQCRDWRDLAKQELEYRAKEKNKSVGKDGDFEAFADKFIKEYRNSHHSGAVLKNSELREAALKEWNKTHAKDVPADSKLKYKPMVITTTDSKGNRREEIDYGEVKKYKDNKGRTWFTIQFKNNSNAGAWAFRDSAQVVIDEAKKQNANKVGVKKTSDTSWEMSRGDKKYYVWKVGDSFRGSSVDPKQNMTDANKIQKFNKKSGFESVDDVKEYVEKWVLK